jgi:F-type H+-transporting ATPase subunit a
MIQQHSQHTDTLHVTGQIEKHDEEGTGNLFVELLHHTQDSREIEYPGGHFELPIILYDEGTLKFFRNQEELNASGQYTLQHNHIFRVSDEQPPALDLSITKHVVFLWVAAIILIIVLARVAKKNRERKIPTGFGSLIEVFVQFIRDDVAIPNMGPGGVRYIPYLLTTFFFILTMNLLGLVPFGASATGNVSVTAALASIAFIMIQASAIRAQGIRHYLAHLTGGVHWILWPIMIPIEILGLFTKPFALCIRLFANMTGGHVVIVCLLGLIFLFKSIWIAPASVAFVIGINFLELFVAFLQAYIFTMLTSLFMGLGIKAAEEHNGGEHGSSHQSHS